MERQVVYFRWAELPRQAVKRPVTALQPTGASHYGTVNRYLVSGPLGFLGPRRERNYFYSVRFLSVLT